MATEDDEDIRSTAKSFLGTMPDEEESAPDPDAPDEDKEAGQLAKTSAMSDFLSAIGVKSSKVGAALEAFEELLGHCNDSGE